MSIPIHYTVPSGIADCVERMGKLLDEFEELSGGLMALFSDARFEEVETALVRLRAINLTAAFDAQWMQAHKEEAEDALRVLQRMGRGKSL